MFENSPPPTLRPRSTAQNVYELLRGDIVLGVLKPLEAIREADIAQRLGVSRTPVREALLRLANLGLVDIYPQSGTRVAPIRLEKVRAAQLIREAVEVEVVRRACRTITARQLDGLKHLLEDQTVAFARGDNRRLFELDEEFHRLVYAAAGLSAVADELEDLKVHLNRLRYVSVNWPRGGDKITGEHSDILAALAARDEGAAAAAMTHHLRAVLPVLDRMAGGDAPSTL
ncbi:MAG: GntR family transcriptional regulator [Devosia sp.]|nr:GntR family transcriptional regulator [Devosia sp.]